jgi:hypothetical protein
MTGGGAQGEEKGEWKDSVRGMHKGSSKGSLDQKKLQLKNYRRTAI